MVRQGRHQAQPRSAGPNLLIPKHSIRYLFKEEELRRARRTPSRVGLAAGQARADPDEAGPRTTGPERAVARRILALTQGDPAGIGPEILLKALARDVPRRGARRRVLVAERAALEAVRGARARGFPGSV